MTLRCITITGADDAVDPTELVALSKDFGFVEWGILFSPKRTGAPRYPSKEWVRRLAIAFDGIDGPPLAAHFCGQCSRDTLAGNTGWLMGTDVLFSRVQLNGFADCTQELVTLISCYESYPEFILQARDEHGLSEAAEVAGRCLTSQAIVSALWDPSGGRGITTKAFPGPPELEDGCAELPLGYAGGIGPDNVVARLRLLHPIGADSGWWIDMESGVRTDDRFDLAKVRRVLEQAASYFNGEAT